MNLRQVLGDLSDHLVTGHQFAVDTPTSGVTDAVVLARANVDTTWPLAVFLAWLERCPEARQYLRGHGLDCEQGGGLATPASPATPAVTGLVDRGGFPILRLSQDQLGALAEPDVTAGEGLGPGGVLTYTKDDTVRAMIHGAMEDCFVTGVSGQLIKVQSVTDSVKMSAIREEHVHPDDRGKLARVLSRFRAGAADALHRQLAEDVRRSAPPGSVCGPATGPVT